MSRLSRFSTPFLLLVVMLCCDRPLFAQCRTIGFETGIAQPRDDLPFRAQLQANQNVVFAVDNNSDLTGDGPAVLEATGVQAGECAAQTCGFQSTNGTQAFDTGRPGLQPGLGTFFLRLPQWNPPPPLIIDFTNPEGVSTAAGEIWDIDGLEQWLVEAFDRNNNIIATQTSPTGQGANLESRPWNWSLSPTSRCPIFKLRIRHVGAPNRAVGLAFDNLTFCDITPDFVAPRLFCDNQPISLTAATATTPPDHQWDLIPSDGGGTSDSNLVGPSLHRCWGPTCTIPPVEPGSYVIKHGIFSQCLPWREQRREISIVRSPRPSAGPDQTICAGESVRLPAGCQPGVSLPNTNITWSPAPDPPTSDDPRCVVARPTQTTTYTIRESELLVGCTGVDSTVIEVMTKPRPRIETKGPCCSRRLVVTGDDIDQVQWSNGETDSEIFVTSPGSYAVVAKNRCGEGTASSTVNDTGIRGAFSRIGAAVGFQPPAVWSVFDADLPSGARPAYGATAYRLWIYSRTGTEERHKLGLVAEGESCSGLRNGEITWDGRINGNIVQDGVYNWVLQLRNCDACHARCQGRRCEAGGPAGPWCNWHRMVRPRTVRSCSRRILGFCVRWTTTTTLVTSVSKVGRVTVLR